jgi:hypothetical protein
MGQLDGKVAFITGAARGQGRSHAITLAREGADIIAVDLCRQAESVPYAMATPDDLAETAKQVEALDRRILALKGDVRDQGQLDAAVAQGIAEFGQIDILGPELRPLRGGQARGHRADEEHRPGTGPVRDPVQLDQPGRHPDANDRPPGRLGHVRVDAGHLLLTGVNATPVE